MTNVFTFKADGLLHLSADFSFCPVKYRIMKQYFYARRFLPASQLHRLRDHLDI